MQQLLQRIAGRGEEDCLVHRGVTLSALAVERLRHEWAAALTSQGVEPGQVVALKSDFSPDAVALLLALLSRGNVAALVPPSAVSDEEYLREACAARIWRATGDGSRILEPTPTPPADHPLLHSLRERGGAGFVIFSSGSAGRPKAVLHDIDRFLRKFEGRGRSCRTLAFLLFDHIAGVDTLFYTLAHGGALVLPESRAPEAVAELIERHRVEVLPTSPTFLNFFLLAHAHEGRDLSSLKVITYGSEPMSAATLDRLAAAFPGVEILQKYGTSEFGSPRTRSRGRDDLWFCLTDAGVEMKVLNGILWVRSESAMLGYLNAPNPIDGEGWYCTGDLVWQDDEWIRVLGRESEVINVGGEKVYPHEVESVIQELEPIEDVLVRGASHPLTGQIVEALVNLRFELDERDVRKLVRAHCRERLPSYKVPVRVLVTPEPLASERHKKRRLEPGGTASS